MSCSVHDLVVVPPLGGSRAMLQPFVSALPSWLRAHVLEPPGFGAASGPRGWPSTRRLAHAALAAWPAVAPERTILFGVSLGGMVAQWLALDAASRMSGVVLASTTDRFRGFGSLRTAARLARCFVAPPHSVHACLVDGIVDVEPAGAQAEAIAEQSPRSKKELLWLAAAAAFHAAPVSKIALPCCVLIGEADALVPPGAQARMVDALPNCRQLRLQGIGHAVTVEAPALTAESVASWVRQLALVCSE